jgi:biotin-(acetyl-CoA carboxylase) ligase
MPLRSRTGLGALLAPDLQLPPPFTPVRLREMGDAFDYAVTVAAEKGAGTLVHVGRFDCAEFALVLEPEEPLRQARRVLYAGMVALVDALAAIAQPESAIVIDWPDTILVNAGQVGGGRIAWPANADEDEVPPWLVFGAMIRTASMVGHEPGVKPDVTALDEEGFGQGSVNHIIESFARNFMVAVDAWHESGFEAVARNYVGYLTGERGLRRDIDDNGDIVVRRAASGGSERRALLPRLTVPGWFDPARKEPRA